jgi:hypothetical protein
VARFAKRGETAKRRSQAPNGSATRMSDLNRRDERALCEVERAWSHAETGAAGSPGTKLRARWSWWYGLDSPFVSIEDKMLDASVWPCGAGKWSEGMERSLLEWNP